MNILLDPNVAYMILVVGFVLGVLALFTPGTGFLEIGALFAIFAAGYSVYNLPINLWALILLILGVIPFIFAVRKFKHWIWLIPGIAMIVVGSVFVFRTETGSPAINPFVAFVVNTVAILILWFVGRKSIDVMKMKPSQDLSRLLGQIGDAKTDIKREGSIHVAGEDWTGRSEVLIHSGDQVKVIGREGLILLVEPVQKKKA